MCMKAFAKPARQVITRANRHSSALPAQKENMRRLQTSAVVTIVLLASSLEGGVKDGAVVAVQANLQPFQRWRCALFALRASKLQLRKVVTAVPALQTRGRQLWGVRAQLACPVRMGSTSLSLARVSATRNLLPVVLDSATTSLGMEQPRAAGHARQANTLHER